MTCTCKDRQYYTLTIEKVARSGYLVTHRPQYNSGNATELLYASTTIDEALKFLRAELYETLP